MLTATLVFGLLCQGGPPLQTDDPGTPGAGRFELNVAFLTEKGDDRTAFEAPLLDLNYGVGERIQLKASVPWIVVDDDPGGTISGVGDTNLGIKYRFVDEETAGISVSTYPQYEFNNGNSSVRRGLADDDSEVFLPVEAERSFGWLDVGVEVGYARSQNGPDRWVYGVAVGHELGERFEVLAELHGSSDRHFDDDQLDLGVGGRFALSDQFGLLFAAGRTIAGSAPDELDFYSYVGCQILF